MKVTTYTFDPSIYADFLPIFNDGFSYTKTDVNNDDGTITRTIESDALPTSISFSDNIDPTEISKSLKTVDYVDISNLTASKDMFRADINLTSINFIGSNNIIINMNAMFYNCPKLTQLDLSNFDTSQVTNMQGMFYNCSELTQLDLSNFDTSNVTSMNSMFNTCSSLTQLDLSSFNTSQVTNTSYMFNNCSSLTKLDISSFNTSKVTNMGDMFHGCTSLTQLDLSSFNTSKVTTMNTMFYNCSKLTQLDLSSFNTSQVTDMSYMFYGCNLLTQLDISNFDTSQVRYMNFMFTYCRNLTQLDLSSFNISNVTSLEKIFYDCSKLESLDISNFDTSQVANTNSIFNICDSLRKIKIINPTTSQLVELLPTKTSSNPGYIFSKVEVPNDKYWTTIIMNDGYNITINSPIPLRRLGNIKDRFYFDNEKGYYCIEQNVGKVVLDGSDDESWSEMSTGSSSDIMYAFRFSLEIPSIEVATNSTNHMCDKLPIKTHSEYNNTSEGIHIHPTGDYLFVNVLISRLSNGGLNAFKLWLQSNPLTVLYQLATPIIIEFPELTNQPRLYQKEDTTISISTDIVEPSKIEVEYKDINNQ